MPLMVIWGPMAVWTLTAGLIYLLQDAWNLGSLSMLLVLASACSALWLDTLWSLVIALLAVLAFNWFLVPPRFTLRVDLHQDWVLLFVLLATSMLVSHLTARLRRSADREARRADQAGQTQQWVQTLSQAQRCEDQIADATDLLARWLSMPVQFLSPSQEAQGLDEHLQRAWSLGSSATGSIGPGTGRFENLTHWAIPVRTSLRFWGCWLIGPLPHKRRESTLLQHAENLSRELGRELDRLQAHMDQRQVQERLQVQQTRNTLLAAISHDYRTPLATIMGAAGSLMAQANLSAADRERAQVIEEEAQHLNRMTTNLLQLGRLETPGVEIRRDLESAEELIGVVMRGCRRRHPGRELISNVPRDLPLLRCDAVLVVQLLDNLMENALRHGDASSAVELQVQVQDQRLVFAVLNRGVRIADADKVKLFEPFLRLPNASNDPQSPGGRERTGLGLGLSLCLAIAKAHEGQLWIEDRPGGGTQVAFALSWVAQGAAT